MAVNDGKQKEMIRVQFVRRVRNVLGPDSVQELGTIAALPLGEANRLIFAGQAIRVPDSAPTMAPPMPEQMEEDAGGEEEEVTAPRRKRARRS